MAEAKGNNQIPQTIKWAKATFIVHYTNIYKIANIEKNYDQNNNSCKVEAHKTQTDQIKVRQWSTNEY